MVNRPFTTIRSNVVGSAPCFASMVDRTMTNLDRLLRILNLLRKSDISYSLEHRRGECVAVCFKLISLPLEIEFYADKVTVQYGGRDAHDALTAAFAAQGVGETPTPDALFARLAA